VVHLDVGEEFEELRLFLQGGAQFLDRFPELVGFLLKFLAIGGGNFDARGRDRADLVRLVVLGTIGEDRDGGGKQEGEDAEAKHGGEGGWPGDPGGTEGEQIKG